MLSPSAHLTKQELQTLRSFFNKTTSQFQSHCRLHLEGHQFLTEKQQELVLKDVQMLDTLYKAGLKHLIKIQLSAGYFLTHALQVEQEIQEQERKGSLLYTQKEEMKKMVALHQKAKKQRLQEVDQYQLILDHLLVQREEKTNLLQLQQLPSPPLPTLTREEVKELLGLFSPLVDEFKEAECRLTKDIFEKELQKYPTAREKLLYAKTFFFHVEGEIALAEARIQEHALIPSSPNPSDQELLSIYQQHISREVDKFVLLILCKKKELCLDSLRQSLLPFPEAPSLPTELSFPQTLLSKT